jgi:hypothetical protein
MREKSLSLGQHHCREVSTMHGVVSSGARRQRKKAAYLLGLAPHWLNAPCVLLFARPKEGLLALWFLAPGSGETQKTIFSLTTLQGWWRALFRFSALAPHHAEILCKRMS